VRRSTSGMITRQHVDAHAGWIQLYRKQWAPTCIQRYSRRGAVVPGRFAGRLYLTHAGERVDMPGRGTSRRTFRRTSTDSRSGSPGEHRRPGRAEAFTEVPRAP
jgi:hypothetical protein